MLAEAGSSLRSFVLIGPGGQYVAEPAIPDDDGAVLSPLLDVLFGFIGFKVPPFRRRSSAPMLQGKEV